jgi:adenylate kinase
MNTGELIDDDTVIAIVEEAIENISSNREFIIDGFPRTLIEATWIANRQKGSVKVFQIILNSSEAIVRLKLRNRPDDNDRAVAKRIEEYEDLIKSILGVFRQKNITIFEIDGSKSIDNVHMQVVGYIKQQEGKVA